MQGSHVTNHISIICQNECNCEVWSYILYDWKGYNIFTSYFWNLPRPLEKGYEWSWQKCPSCWNFFKKLFPLINNWFMAVMWPIKSAWFFSLQKLTMYILAYMHRYKYIYFLHTHTFHSYFLSSFCFLLKFSLKNLPAQSLQQVTFVQQWCRQQLQIVWSNWYGTAVLKAQLMT